MDNNQTDAYTRRFRKVFDHIERHLDEPLSLERLSAVAHFSPFHFHRQFAAYCGMPLGRYIQVLRLKQASYRLAFNPLEKVTEIALDAGFQHAESFSRAFKQTFGLTPQPIPAIPGLGQLASVPAQATSREDKPHASQNHRVPAHRRRRLDTSGPARADQ